jgi:hypothetical protein
VSTKEQANVKHKKQTQEQNAKRTKTNLQSTCPIVIHQQVNGVSTKEQANAKHKKKPRTKHRRAKANLQNAQIKCIIIRCAKV